MDDPSAGRQAKVGLDVRTVTDDWLRVDCFLAQRSHMAGMPSLGLLKSPRSGGE
jgi:hypothetical protein